MVGAGSGMVRVKMRQVTCATQLQRNGSKTRNVRPPKRDGERAAALGDFPKKITPPAI
jgi:hypothetical protein